jgi:hypothetical protein
MRLLPDVFTVETFNIAELYACVRDGEMFAVDSAFVTCDLPVTPVTRLHVVCGDLDPRFVVAGLSAAWVHQVIHDAPARHCVALRDGLRLRLDPESHYDLTQMSFAPDDVWELGGRFVTTPLRTAIDFARFDADHYDLNRVLAELLSLARADMSAIRAVIERGRHLPFKQRAYKRLEAALAFAHSVDVVDGINASDTVEESV